MKNSFNRPVALFTFVMAFGIIGIGYQVSNPVGGVTLSIKNLEALADDEDPGGMDCWSIASPCYIFGCSYVTLCEQPCQTYKVDSWESPGKCD